MLSTRARPCQICFSPIRGEIEAFLRKGYSQRVIAEKYLSHFSCGVETLRVKISRHKNKHLRKFMSLVVQTDKSGSSKTSVEALAAGLLKIGMMIVERYPDQVKLRDVISSQKLLLDKAKLSSQENALKLAMARFFGGFPLEPVKSDEIIGLEARVVPSNNVLAKDSEV